MWLTVCAVLSACGLGGCSDLHPGNVADDTLVAAPVDAGSLEDVLREAFLQCRLELIDAGRMPGGPPPRFDYCSLAFFYEGCPLRVCAERLAVNVRPRCPPRDAGLDTKESRICEELVWPFLPAED